MGEIGIRAGDAGAAAAIEPLRNALAEWVRCVDFSGSQLEPAQGIVLFEHVDLRLLQTLQELSAGGSRRVLALQVGGAELRTDDHWALLRAGATDVNRWAGPSSATDVVARLLRWEQVDALMRSKVVTENLCGDSPAFRRVLREIVEVAYFTGSNALVLGESGTGKELTARLIHTLDMRPDKGQLVVLDCTTVVSELAGSEFFGHERGSFTGAVGARDGAFALAHNGTLFLDEIGELPRALQAQLLRVIQERMYKRVGGSEWHTARFRLICATHRDLESEVRNGRFRHDLYHRITQSVFRMPALRERPQDILPLARRFLNELFAGESAVEFHAPVREYLQQRSYPGNVRELRQLSQRIAARHVGRGAITAGDIPEDERPQGGALDWRGPEFDAAIRRALGLGAGLKDIGHHAAEAAIRIALADEEGNLQRAARRLGVTDRALQLRRAQRDAG